MKKGKLTRDEAIAIVGEEYVTMLDNESCEQTGRLQCDGDPDSEWSASVSVNHDDYRTLTAYYYTTPEDEAVLADNDGDGSSINWEIDGYELA